MLDYSRSDYSSVIRHSGPLKSVVLPSEIQYSDRRDISAVELDKLLACVDKPPRGRRWERELAMAAIFRSAWHERKLVGVIIGECDDGVCLGSNLAVDEAYQGRHIGRSLLVQTLAQAKRHGCTRFVFYVDDSPRPGGPRPDPRALTLYKHMGFARDVNEYWMDL